ncbi:MAG: hypothetical protein WDO19_24050 [Bacteroidota bacterium]
MKSLFIKSLRCLGATAAISGFSIAAFSQPAIKGPACVTTGVQYDYFISGNPDSVSAVTVCIAGGSFTDSKTACRTVKPFTNISVTWNIDVKEGRLSIRSDAAADSLSIYITSLLDAGVIDVSLKKQSIRYDTFPSLITCSQATGGNCSPVYIYQWQSSPDGINWSDIKGETGQNLLSRSSLKESIFYRRKVTEKGSGTIGYSNIATVFVDADYKSHQLISPLP